MGTMRKLRILLVDDSLIFLDAAARQLRQVPEIEKVCTAGSGREAVALAQSEQPDLAIVDLDMPGMSGMVTAIHLKSLSKPPLVLIISGHGEAVYRALAGAVPADGFLDKSEFAGSIVRQLREMAPASRPSA
jgi:DNA-binding NarL/FixJ family response regulator